MQTTKYTIIIIFIVCSIAGYPQTFEEYYEQQKKEYSEYKEEKDKEFQKFIEEKDKEFSKHLKENWDSFEMKRGQIRAMKPKPDPYPVFKDSIQQEYKILEYEYPLNEMDMPGPDVRHKEPTNSFEFYRMVNTSFVFFGEKISIDHEKVNYLDHPGFTNKVIGEGWDKLNKAGFYNCIPQLQQYKNGLNLNDWGYYLLVKDFSQKVSGGKEYYKLMMWYILLKSGYNVRVGYTGTRLLLLVPFKSNIYEVPYYIIDDKQYYVFETESPGRIKSYIHPYPYAKKSIEPRFTTTPNFNSPDDKKVISCKYNGGEIEFTVPINKALQAYYQSFPVMELANYFNSPMSPQTEKSLVESLGQKITPGNEEKSVNYLLHFTQHAFLYKTDSKQFGTEKIFFPDEIFYYQYSDCEDRSVFFAYIVKKMLNVKVIGLEFPDHVAVAVHFNTNIEGNYINWEGDKYVVCDPTYTNAPIGKMLPGHLNSKTTIIQINN